MRKLGRIQYRDAKGKTFLKPIPEDVPEVAKKRKRIKVKQYVQPISELVEPKKKKRRTKKNGIKT